MKKIIKKITNIIILICIIIFILMFIFSIFYKVFGFYKTNYVWESKNRFVVAINDNLMNPILKMNDIAFFEKYKAEDLKEGDIIYFKDDNTYNIAKIEEVKTDTLGEKKYKTKGIQNYYYNQNFLKSEDIEGKYYKRIGYLGILYKISVSNMFSVIIILFLLFMIIKLQSNKKRSIKRKLKREEFERKK